MIDLDRYFKYLIKLKLTQQQFLLLYLLYEERYDLIKKYKEHYPTDDGSMIGKYFTDDLVKRKFIKVRNERNEMGKVIQVAELTPKFPSIFADSDYYADEVWERYPRFFTNSKGVRIPLKLLDKDAFKRMYINKIKASIEEHNKVMKDIAYGKDRNLINCKIDLFFKSEHYLSIREERIENEDNNISNTNLTNF